MMGSLVPLPSLARGPKIPRVEADVTNQFLKHKHNLLPAERSSEHVITPLLITVLVMIAVWLTNTEVSLSLR